MLSVSHAIAIRRTFERLRTWEALPWLAGRRRAGSDLDEHENLAVEDDQAKLAKPRPVVAGEDLEPESPEVVGGEILPRAGPRRAGRLSSLR